MKFSRIVVVVIVIAIVGIAFYSLSPGSSDDDYKIALTKERQQKDEFMKHSKESPFVEKDSIGKQGKDLFTGLKYYEIDPAYRINATLRSIEEKKVVVLPTSSAEESHYLEYAWAEFEWDGVKNKLLLLEVMDMGPARRTLFLAFADETSANETYGAGRYLDIKKVPGASTIELDFNKAYNPYCAYSDKYSCPLPPRENVLNVPIKAGERNYH